MPPVDLAAFQEVIEEGLGRAHGDVIQGGRPAEVLLPEGDGEAQHLLVVADGLGGDAAPAQVAQVLLDEERERQHGRG